jgi:hypothetical protein
MVERERVDLLYLLEAIRGFGDAMLAHCFEAFG